MDFKTWEMYSKMSIDEQSLTREVRKHDKNLYAKRNAKGTMCIWCNHKRTESYSLDENTSLSVVVEDPYLVFALTDTWGVRGNPAPWGATVVLNRLKAMDLANNPKIMEDLEKEDERVDESKRRDFVNSTESFLYDFRSQFKKTFNDINVSNL